MKEIVSVKHGTKWDHFSSEMDVARFLENAAHLKVSYSDIALLEALTDAGGICGIFSEDIALSGRSSISPKDIYLNIIALGKLALLQSSRTKTNNSILDVG